VEATADAATKSRLRRLALFGTRFTMQATLFPEAFERRGMTIVVPNEKEQEFIHEKYMGELFVGAILDETRAALVDIVATMKQRDNVDGLIPRWHRAVVNSARTDSCGPAGSRYDADPRRDSARVDAARMKRSVKSAVIVSRSECPDQSRSAISHRA
jgi:hypothetical protein